MEREIKSYAEYQEAIKSGKVIVDFYATWCGPCQMLAPLLKAIAEEHPELSVLRVDVDAVPEAAAHYNVYSIPTLLRIEDGELKATQIGYLPRPSLERFIGL